MTQHGFEVKKVKKMKLDTYGHTNALEIYVRHINPRVKDEHDARNHSQETGGSSVTP